MERVSDKKESEIETSMKWILKELNSLLVVFTDEKIRLMQDKNLLHRLDRIIMLGSNRLTPYENSQISDMILSRKGKKPCDLIKNSDDNIDLDNEED